MTFGDGVKIRVLGNGTLNIRGFPKLKNVLHVDGRKANLISISQICELNLYVKFTHDKCFVLNEFGECVLEGSTSLDNCYTLSPPHTCHKGIVDDVNMFFKFSKEEVVNSFTEEAVNEAHLEHSVVILEKSIVTEIENKSIAIEKTRRQVVRNELVDLLVCLGDPFRKESSSWVKKNHPNDRITSKLGDTSVTRRR